MTAGPVYLDSSALLKLVFEEPETQALERFLIDWPTRISSVLAQVEVVRIARRVGDELVTRHAREVLAGVSLIAPDRSLFADASQLEPPALRTLDAVHLATAVSLRPALAGMVVYDRRLANAARAEGLTVWAPA